MNTCGAVILESPVQVCCAREKGHDKPGQYVQHSAPYAGGTATRMESVNEHDNTYRVRVVVWDADNRCTGYSSGFGAASLLPKDHPFYRPLRTE